MALQVLVMTFACGPLIVFFFCLCVGWKMSLYLVVGIFSPSLQNFWSLCLCVCVWHYIRERAFGFGRGEGKKRGELLHVHFCSFFGCLVDGQSLSSFFIAWNHIEMNKYVFFLLFNLCISFGVCKFKLLLIFKFLCAKLHRTIVLWTNLQWFMKVSFWYVACKKCRFHCFSCVSFFMCVNL